MGVFLCMSGIAGASKAEVEAVLRQYANERGRSFQSVAASGNDGDLLVVTEASESKVAILYPDGFLEWDDASAYLSLNLKKPVFSFHIHDGDLWMYVLFVNGEAVDQFNPIPAYWDEGLPDEELQRWSGDAAIVSSFWPGITVEKIKNYLVQWDLDQLAEGRTSKAYVDDEFCTGEDWQVTDFMRKLGLTYPLDKQGKPMGDTFQFSET